MRYTIDAKTLDTINDEINEILEIFLENISYDINDYDAKFGINYKGHICIDEIDLNQDNERFMKDLKEIMSKHFKINKHK
jgi:hypothetical protein